jgi:hypothetical protein
MRKTHAWLFRRARAVSSLTSVGETSTPLSSSSKGKWKRRAILLKKFTKKRPATFFPDFWITTVHKFEMKKILFSLLLHSVLSLDPLIPDPIRHFRLNTNPDPGFWWKKIWKIYKRKFCWYFFSSKLSFTRIYPYASIKDVQAREEAFSPQKRTYINSKLEISSLIFAGRFALLDPDIRQPKSMRIHKERQRYRRSLQTSRENTQLEISSLFTIFVGHFCPPGSGSGTLETAFFFLTEEREAVEKLFRGIRPFAQLEELPDHHNKYELCVRQTEKL